MLYIFIYLEIIIFSILLLIDFLNYKKFTLLDRINIFKIANKIDILIHSSSRGESKLTLPLIKKLNENNIKTKLSIHTPTGFNLINKYTNNCFLKPYDSPIMTFIMFLLLRPKIIIISERDTWPFFILYSKILKCKIYFINYKVKKNRKINNIIHYLIANKIFTIEKKNQFSKYSYLGDIKFLSNECYLQKKSNLTVIIASANENEISIHLKFIKNIIEYYPLIKIIYVPRYLNWKKKFKYYINDIKHKFIKDINEINQINKNLLICWKNGLLNKLYSYSHICLMGDTFNNIGGHNLIEPAINKNVIITGPNVDTCYNQTKIIKNVFILKNIIELTNITLDIIKNKKYKKYGEENYKCISDHKLIVENNINSFISLLQSNL